MVFSASRSKQSLRAEASETIYGLDIYGLPWGMVVVVFKKCFSRNNLVYLMLKWKFLKCLVMRSSLVMTRSLVIRRSLVMRIRLVMRSCGSWLSL